MKRFYGIAGAHRTGKTTLARDLAEKIGAKFLETNLSGVLKDFGINPQKALPFEQRLEVQRLLLGSLVGGYCKALKDSNDDELIIVDRTPADILAYTYADISMGVEPADFMEEHEQIVYEMLNNHFHGLIVVPPAIPLVADTTKAAANRFYQKHVHYALIGVISDDRNYVPSVILPLSMTSRESRVSFAASDCLAILDTR